MTLSRSGQTSEPHNTTQCSCSMRSSNSSSTAWLCLEVTDQVNKAMLCNIRRVCNHQSAGKPYQFVSKCSTSWTKHFYEIFIPHAISDQQINRMTFPQSGQTKERSNFMKYSFNMRSPLARSNAWLCLEAGNQVNKTILWNIHPACHLRSADQPHDFPSKRPNKGT